MRMKFSKKLAELMSVIKKFSKGYISKKDDEGEPLAKLIDV